MYSKRNTPPSQARRKKATERGILMMNKYTLEAIVEGKLIRFHRQFHSRNDAINYIFSYYNRHQLVELKINDEYFIGNNKHDIAYVYDYENRFRIARA